MHTYTNTLACLCTQKQTMHVTYGLRPAEPVGKARGARAQHILLSNDMTPLIFNVILKKGCSGNTSGSLEFGCCVLVVSVCDWWEKLKSLIIVPYPIKGSSKRTIERRCWHPPAIFKKSIQMRRSITWGHGVYVCFYFGLFHFTLFIYTLHTALPRQGNLSTSQRNYSASFSQTDSSPSRENLLSPRIAHIYAFR